MEEREGILTPSLLISRLDESYVKKQLYYSQCTLDHYRFYFSL